MPPPTVLSAFLARRVEQLDMTSDAFAARMHAEGSPVSAQAVRAWLTGDFAPVSTKLATIAKVLDVGLTDIALAAAGVEPPGAS